MCLYESTTLNGVRVVSIYWPKICLQKFPENVWFWFKINWKLFNSFIVFSDEDDTTKTGTSLTECIGLGLQWRVKRVVESVSKCTKAATFMSKCTNNYSSGWCPVVGYSPVCHRSRTQVLLWCGQVRVMHRFDHGWHCQMDQTRWCLAVGGVCHWMRWRGMMHWRCLGHGWQYQMDQTRWYLVVDGVCHWRRTQMCWRG